MKKILVWMALLICISFSRSEVSEPYEPDLFVSYSQWNAFGGFSADMDIDGYGTVIVTVEERMDAPPIKVYGKISAEDIQELKGLALPLMEVDKIYDCDDPEYSERGCPTDSNSFAIHIRYGNTTKTFSWYAGIEREDPRVTNFLAKINEISGRLKEEEKKGQEEFFTNIRNASCLAIFLLVIFFLVKYEIKIVKRGDKK